MAAGRIEKAVSAHEDLSRSVEVKEASDRAFGFVFTGVFTLVGLWPLLRHAPIRMWAFPVAGVFLSLALLRPALLHPLNRLWTMLGLRMNRVMTFVVTGILFFLVITPMSAVLRLMGKDPLRLSRDPGAESYWITRQPPGPAPESMINQF